MTKAEMQAEIDRLNEQVAGWRELATVIHETLGVSYPDAARWPDSWMTARYDALNERAAFMRGVLGNTLNSSTTVDARPEISARVIRKEFQQEAVEP